MLVKEILEDNIFSYGGDGFRHPNGCYCLEENLFYSPNCDCIKCEVIGGLTHCCKCGKPGYDHRNYVAVWYCPDCVDKENKDENV